MSAPLDEGPPEKNKAGAALKSDPAKEHCSGIVADRSSALLACGRRALELGDLDGAERALEQLGHEGSEAHFRELAAAFIARAAA